MLIKSEATEEFNGHFGLARDKSKIVEFVKGKLESKKPKARKKAREFLKRWARQENSYLQPDPVLVGSSGLGRSRRSWSIMRVGNTVGVRADIQLFKFGHPD